jgi:hypothetical protein
MFPLFNITVGTNENAPKDSVSQGGAKDESITSKSASFTTQKEFSSLTKNPTSGTYSTLSSKPDNASLTRSAVSAVNTDP